MLNRRRRYRIPLCHRLFSPQNRSTAIIPRTFFMKVVEHVSLWEIGWNSLPRRERRSIMAKSQRRLWQLSLYRCTRDVLFRLSIYNWLRKMSTYFHIVSKLPSWKETLVRCVTLKILSKFVWFMRNRRVSSKCVPRKTHGKDKVILIESLKQVSSRNIL